MTDRYYAITVVLKENTRDDDAKPIIDAIKMLRGVLSATPHVADFETHWAEKRAKQELQDKILHLLV